MQFSGLVVACLLFGCHSVAGNERVHQRFVEEQCIDVSHSALPVTKQWLISRLATATGIPPDQVRIYRICKMHNRYLIGVYREGGRSKLGGIALFELDASKQLNLVPHQ